MSDSNNTIAKNPESKKVSEQNLSQPGSSKFPHMMGRPPMPPVLNLNFPRQTHFFTNRTHDPNEKMKTWFSNEQYTQESRSSSWMVDNRSYKPTCVTEVGNTEDFWESDLSDDFINQIMNDNFEESLLKASQVSTSSKSQQYPSGPKPSENRSKPNDKLGINSKLSSSSSVQRSGPPAKSQKPNQSTLNLSARSSSSSSIFSDSQRKLIKPTKSFNLPNSQSLTTEWLRNQLVKVNKECKSLKESVSAKDGESKILREKLSDAKMTIEKQKMDKEIECLNIKTTLEEKIKLLKKELQSAKTQILFKSKEAESNIERYKELKKVNVIEPKFSQSFSSSQSLKKLINRSGKSKSSLETTGTNQIELTISPKNIQSVNTKNLQSTFTQTESNEIEIGELPSKEEEPKLILNFKKEEESFHCGNELSFMINPDIFQTAKPEYSILIPPAIDYYPFDILYRDVSEFPTDDNDDWSVQANLAKLWNVDGQIGKKKNPNEAIRKNRLFSSLSTIHLDIFEVCRLQMWDNSSSIQQIVQHVTKMARELYIAFRDPEVLASRTVRAREIQTHYACFDVSELEGDFNIFSPTAWKKEIYVDLRRGVALIAALCNIDTKIQKLILRQSNFIIDQKFIKSGEEIFSVEEKNYITCVTDTFTNELAHRTTFLHHRASEFQCTRAKDISKRLEKNRKRLYRSQSLKNNLETSNSSKEAPKKTELLNDLNKLSLLMEIKTNLKNKDNLIKTTRDEKSSVIPHNKQCDDFIAELDLKIEQSLVLASEPNRSSKEDCEEASTSKAEEVKDCVMNKLIQNELENWTGVGSSASGKISKKVLQLCSSESERELISSTFNNFLQIKASMDGNDIPLLTDDDECFILEPEVKESNFSEDEVTQSRKRKIVSEPEPSTSKDSVKPSETSKKRDLAPLKKPRKDEDAEEEMDTQDIQNELEMIYQEDKSEVPIAATQVLNSPSEENHPITNVIQEDDSGQMYEYLYPEEIASQCELLAILLEVVRSIGFFRYSINFNALLTAIVKLLNSLKDSCSSHDIRVHYLCTIVLEIIYCRPSPLVLLEVHHFLCNYVPIPYFARMICHNSHPNKFVNKPYKIEFRRGACLLSMICSLTELYTVDTNWDIQFLFFRWVNCLFLVDTTVITRIYCRQRTTSGQCSCVQSLDNCIIKVLMEAVVSYYECLKENKFSSLMKHQIDSIIKQGVRVLSVILEIDRFFLQNMSHKYKTFVSFLETVHFFHLSKDIDFQLQKTDMCLLKVLLEDKVVKQVEKKYDRESNLQMATGIFNHSNFNLRSKFISFEKEKS